MLTSMAIFSGLIGLAVAVLELSHRLDGASGSPLDGESALREAMRGPGGGAIRAEFQRRGVETPLHHRPPIAFGL
jgi:hypothetical protein